ncbi:MAG: helix-turn-helix transcriptional regulator [Alphaproteobacteria bacterium]|nr:helix-turn-helix transcriptional regulator [Alphaproteobacteria bacterium]
MNGRALLAWNLRRLRAERGVSQEHLAVDAGIDRTYLSLIERELGNASVDVMDRLAKCLSAELGDFFIRPARGTARPQPLPKGRKPKR